MGLSLIVLAAGLSRRMGLENKLLLPLGGQTILGVTVDHALSAGLGEVIVVVGHESEDVRRALVGKELVRVVENERFDLGMTTSIQAGVLASSLSCRGYMICLSDMPFIVEEEYRALGEAFLRFYVLDERVILIPAFGGERGNPVVFSSFYREVILGHDNMEGCRGILQVNKGHVRVFEMGSGSVLWDIDSREDYLRVV